MKKLFPLIFLFVTGCSSIRFVTTDHGQIITDRDQPLNIVGNPRLTCFDKTTKIIADGYFVRQLEDGSFIVDEFGNRYVIIKNPMCRLSDNGEPQD